PPSSRTARAPPPPPPSSPTRRSPDLPAPTRRQHEPHRDCRRPSSPRSRTAEPAAAHRTSGADRPSPPPTAAARSERWPPCPFATDRKSTRLNSSHVSISYAVFCLKKK